MIVTDDQAADAVMFLNKNAEKAAKAKAHRVYMEEYRKTVKSNEMQKHDSKAIGVQEREAYASENYKQHLLAMRDAIYQDELARWGMAAAQATLEAWRTGNANRRAESKA